MAYSVRAAAGQSGLFFKALQHYQGLAVLILLAVDLRKREQRGNMMRRGRERGPQLLLGLRKSANPRQRPRQLQLQRQIVGRMLQGLTQTLNEFVTCGHEV